MPAECDLLTTKRIGLEAASILKEACLQGDLERMEFEIPDRRFADLVISRRRDGRHFRLGGGRLARANGRYASVKVGATMPWESKAELHDMYRAEVDPEVVRFAPQPERLAWRFNGLLRSYIPDRTDYLANGQCRTVEVKRDYDADGNPDYSEKLSQVSTIYGYLGRAFELRDYTLIGSEPSFSAVEEIQAYRRTLVTADDVHSMRIALCSGPSTMREAQAALQRSRSHSIVCAMMVRRLISIDISDGLHDGCEVSLIQDNR